MLLFMFESVSGARFSAAVLIMLMLRSVTDSRRVSLDSVTNSRRLGVFKGIDSYEKRRIIGSGGFGTVWKAKDQQGENVVIKETKNGIWRYVTALRREAELLQAVQHCPHVIRFVEAGSDSDGLNPYLVMKPFAALGDLSQAKYDVEAWRKYAEENRLHDAHGFGPLKRLSIQVLETLSCLHAAGIIFSDLKPANLIPAPHADTMPKNRIVKLAIRKRRKWALENNNYKWFEFLAPGHELLLSDFGVAFRPAMRNSIISENRTCTGTNSWMPPECFVQHNGYQGHIWSFDAFSLGAILLHFAANITFPDYPTRCFKLANPTKLDAALARDTPEGQLGVTDMCLRELIIRLTALDPLERISPQAALPLAAKIGDEAGCRQVLEEVQGRPSAVSKDTCMNLNKSAPSYGEALKKTQGRRRSRKRRRRRARRGPRARARNHGDAGARRRGDIRHKDTEGKVRGRGVSNL